jgi:hypothetical protein
MARAGVSTERDPAKRVVVHTFLYRFHRGYVTWVNRATVFVKRGAVTKVIPGR